MKVKKNTVSPQTQQEAMSMAKATQKQGQSKEHTKLIAQGIEKGITLYKKQQKEKQREADKLRKKQLKLSQARLQESDTYAQTAPTLSSKHAILPWLLLLISWSGFGLYILSGK